MAVKRRGKRGLMGRIGYPIMAIPRLHLPALQSIMFKSSCVSTTFTFNECSSIIEVGFKGSPPGNHPATFRHSTLRFRVHAEYDGVITVYRKMMDLEDADLSSPFEFSVGLSCLNIAEAVHYQGHLSSVSLYFFLQRIQNTEPIHVKIEDDDSKPFQVEGDREYSWEMEEDRMRSGGCILFYFVPEYRCSGFVEVEWKVATWMETIRKGLRGFPTGMSIITRVL
jgi:hypothetical protein